MKRVAEIIHIVEDRREEFLRGALNMDDASKRVLWSCGVRKQQYFYLGELIFMTFEYKGNDFAKDMAKMAAYLDSKNCLVQKRRKDVPVEERANTDWWAPVKSLGTLLEAKPSGIDEEENDWEEKYAVQVKYAESNPVYDTAYDDDDWTESMHI